MITAEEYFKSQIPKYQSVSEFMTDGDIFYHAREFAKLHVKAAIKECIESAPSGSSTDTVSYEDVVECLKDCYPLTNIK